MKQILAIVSITIVMTLSQGCMRLSDRESTQLKSELVECINDAISTINDSSFQNVVVKSIDSSTPCYDIYADAPIAESPGVVKVDIHVEQDDPSDWFIGYVAILAVITGPLVPILIVWIICYFIFKSKRDRNRIIMAAIERNYPLPNDFITPKLHTEARLQPAINYIAFGIGIMAFFYAINCKSVALLMLIPIIVGLGKLVSFLMSANKQKSLRHLTDDTTDNSDAY